MASYAVMKHLPLPASRLCCYLCGASGLTEECTLDNCKLTFHPWCARRYSPNSDGSICAEHDGNCIRRASNRYKQLLKKAHVEFEMGTDREKPGIRGGTSFAWFVLNAFYFPAGADLSQLPQRTNQSMPEVCEQSCFIDEEIAATTKRLRELSGSYQSLLDIAKQHPNYPSFSPLQPLEGKMKHASEEKLVLLELQDERARRELKECWKLLEKGRQSEDTISTTGSVSEGKANCAVCTDLDSQDEAVVCARCNSSFHTGSTGSQNWLCDVCTYMPAHKLPCALCGLSGGAMKRTINRAGSLDLPTYPYSQDENLWVHVFCARLTPGVTFSGMPCDSMRIDLSGLEFFKTPCAVCKVRTGVVIGCNQILCKEAFHAECGKKQNMVGKFRDGVDHIKMFCNKHRPLSKLTDIALLSKKLADRVLAYAKPSENARICDDNKQRKRKKWSRHEDKKFLRIIDTFLKKSGQQQTFRVEVKMGAPASAKVILPERAVLSPDQIKTNRLSIPGRTVSQCKSYYTKKLLPRLERKRRRGTSKTPSAASCSLCGSVSSLDWKCAECESLIHSGCLTIVGYSHLLTEAPFKCPSCSTKRRKLDQACCSLWA
mmetsp:Transcript_16014/g.29338  ORF Transcript_16014/g.29338 Transcript_16014/m.29338 type:complete len:601 (-) Transcript_16014:2826-4628(-)